MNDRNTDWLFDLKDTLLDGVSIGIKNEIVDMQNRHKGDRLFLRLVGERKFS